MPIAFQPPQLLGPPLKVNETGLASEPVKTSVVEPAATKEAGQATPNVVAPLTSVMSSLP